MAFPYTLRRDVDHHEQSIRLDVVIGHVVQSISTTSLSTFLAAGCLGSMISGAEQPGVDLAVDLHIRTAEERPGELGPTGPFACPAPPASARRWRRPRRARSWRPARSPYGRSVGGFAPASGTAPSSTCQNRSSHAAARRPGRNPASLLTTVTPFELSAVSISEGARRST